MAPAEPGLIAVEVAYSPAAREVELLPLTLAAGTPVLQALRAAGWFARHPEVDPAQVSVGVWGRRVSLSHPLREGDRVEVYRALQVDPKEARRLRYRKQGDRGRVRRKKPEAV
jgi:putative ubiquitin-RnfH superfamily antitoxin RatB of RatAB toxin-antitoxin module